MLEWLNAAIPAAADLPTAALVGMFVQAAVFGLVVAAVYFVTQRKRRADAAPFVATLVLLTILIAMVTQVIGDNTARAFSLAGALAIIRFRTVVDDTRDTAFVIFGVVVGMAVGAGMLKVALSGMPVAIVVAWLLSVWGRRPAGASAHGNLTVRLGVGLNPDDVIGKALAAAAQTARLTAADTARGGAALDVTYATVLRPKVGVVPFLNDLTKVEGVLGVEWKETGGSR